MKTRVRLKATVCRGLSGEYGRCLRKRLDKWRVWEFRLSRNVMGELEDRCVSMNLRCEVMRLDVVHHPQVIRSNWCLSSHLVRRSRTHIIFGTATSPQWFHPAFFPSLISTSFASSSSLSNCHTLPSMRRHEWMSYFRSVVCQSSFHATSSSLLPRFSVTRVSARSCFYGPFQTLATVGTLDALVDFLHVFSIDSVLPQTLCRGFLPHEENHASFGWTQ